LPVLILLLVVLDEILVFTDLSDILSPIYFLVVFGIDELLVDMVEPTSVRVFPSQFHIGVVERTVQEIVDSRVGGRLSANLLRGERETLIRRHESDVDFHRRQFEL
jgi:hypothetical protein